MFAGCGVRAAGTKELPVDVGGGGESEFGLYGGVGGMMVIAGLAYNEIGSRRKCRDGDFFCRGQTTGKT